jgi:hypothetical protein
MRSKSIHTIDKSSLCFPKMTRLDKRWKVILLPCLYLRVFWLVWCWIISHPNKIWIKLPSCNVKILASLKNHISWYSFGRIAKYVFNLALHTSLGSDLGQNMCHHYLIVYALKKITCTLHCHFAYRSIYTTRALHVWYPEIKLALYCQYNVQVETVDIFLIYVHIQYIQYVQ